MFSLRFFPDAARRMLFLCLAAALAGFSPSFLSAQDGASSGFPRAQMLGLRTQGMEWQWLRRIQNGENPPTAVQTVSAAEAAFYGFTPETPDLEGRKVFLLPELRVQPFFTAWNGLDTARGSKDFALRRRLALDKEILAAGISFGSASFFGHIQFDLTADELVRKAGSSGSLGFWQPLEYGKWMTFPREGYISWAGSHLSVAAGRFPTGIGMGEENLILNGSAFWYDNVQLSWWSEKFKFFTMLGSSSSQLSTAEWEVQKKDWDSINNHDAATGAYGSEGVTIPLKLFTYHRFEWKPFRRFGLGITEMQLIGGKAPDLFNLLPMSVWHNAYSAAVTNVMFQVDLWALPVDGLLVYGEFLLDDVQSFVESGASKPNCLAWELGALYTLPLDVPGWLFFISGEYTHAGQWTYTRWQPYLTMYQRQIASGGHSGLDTPLGHSEGGDVDTAGISFGAVTEAGGRIEFGYKYIRKGPVYLNEILDGDPLYYDYAEYDSTGALAAALNRPDKKSHCFLLEAVWPFAGHFEAAASLDLRWVQNTGHRAGENAWETIVKTGVLWHW